MSATKYTVYVNGAEIVTRSRKEQAEKIYNAEVADNTESTVELKTSAGSVLMSREGVKAETVVAEVTEDVKEPVTAPETTDDALLAMQAEINEKAEARKRVAIPGLPGVTVPASVAPDAVPNHKRPKVTSTYIIYIDGAKGPQIQGRPAAIKEHGLQVKANPGQLVELKNGDRVILTNADKLTAPAAEVKPEAPKAEVKAAKTAAPAQIRRNEKKDAPKRGTVGHAVAQAEKKAAKKPAAKKTAPAAPVNRPAPGSVRDAVIAFLDDHAGESFTSVQIMHGLGRTNGVNNISTELANRGVIAWASKPNEVKRFTSIHTEKKRPARKTTAKKSSVKA